MSAGLNRVTWAAVATVIAVVAVSSLTLPYGPIRNLIDMVDASVIAVLTLSLRVAVERFPSRRLWRRVLPFALTAAAVTSGWAALTQSGGPFVILAAMATSAAAYDFGLAAACAITATGVVAVDAGGLAYGVGTWGLVGVPLLMILGLLLGRLGHAQRAAAEGLTETRRALQALRSDTPPLAEALDDLSAEHRRHYLTPVTLEVNGPARALQVDAALALTRAAQESLINAAKHAPHQPVLVQLDFSAGPTTLTVRNPLTDGEGHLPGLETINGGYGLAGMRERLRLIGGSLDARADNGHWIVTAQVPR